MKQMKLNKINIIVLALGLLMQVNKVEAQDDSAATPIVKLHYFNNNNSMQDLLLESSLKKNKVFTAQKNKTYELFLDSASAGNHIARLVTNEEGKAKAFIPVALKESWNAAAQHTFIVKAGEEEVITDYVINKAKITIDTSTTDGVRSITASVMKLNGSDWAPAADVELKIGIARLGGILSAGDEATYTTDSTGTVTVELKKDSLPGDLKGNYILTAKVEDNDQFGNLLVEKTVPWGTKLKQDNSFFNLRTLWTTRFRTPYWLLLMAYGIVIAVWSTMIYLVLQIVKIKKLGA
ncbi:hypothetical protein BH11BAC4_BH11BAC4_22830 [soil metagenome]